MQSVFAFALQLQNHHRGAGAGAPLRPPQAGQDGPGPGLGAHLFVRGLPRSFRSVLANCGVEVAAISFLSAVPDAASPVTHAEFSEVLVHAPRVTAEAGLAAHVPPPPPAPSWGLLTPVRHRPVTLPFHPRPAAPPGKVTLGRAPAAWPGEVRARIQFCLMSAPRF